VSLTGFLQSIRLYFKLYGFKGGFVFAVGLMRCRTESIYSIRPENREKNLERFINPELEVKLISNAEDFAPIRTDYAAATGTLLAQRGQQSITSGKEFLTVVYKQGRLAGWGWVKKGPVTYGNCKVGENECVIHKCRTLPDYRRQGVYSTLLVSLQDILANKGFQRIYIGAKSFNKVSLRGIERAGFEFVEECNLGTFTSRLWHHIRGKGPKVMQDTG
jgi:GNAT superfamily N-acetyltransferase